LSEPEQLASTAEDEFQPDYSGDGKYIGFHVTRSAALRDLYVMPAGGGPRQRVQVFTKNNFSPHLSADGQAMVYNCPLPERAQICASRRTSGPAAESLFAIPQAINPDWSTYQNYRFSFDVHGSTLYISLAQPESDVWLAEIKAH
jgi:Tol biopolymer transport system component